MPQKSQSLSKNSIFFNEQQVADHVCNSRQKITVFFEWAMHRAIEDPNGFRIELWEPKKAEPEAE